MSRKHLQNFYGQHAPFKRLTKLLTNGSKRKLENVELGLRWPSKEEGEKEIFKRNKLVFGSAGEFRAYCTQTVPTSIEVGATVPTGADEHDTAPLIEARRKAIVDCPTEWSLFRHLVFDWDIDHDQRRQWNKCLCGPKEICDRCWMAFAEPAKESLLYVLREYCRFKRIVPCFSGRRGIHFWVLDDEVSFLSEQQRQMLLERISLQGLLPSEPLKKELYQILEKHYDRHHQGAPYKVMDLLYKLDAEPTIKMKHLIGAPLFSNASTKMIRAPIATIPFMPSGDAEHILSISNKKLVQMEKYFKK